MAKTRSQSAAALLIKKEEEEDSKTKLKHTQLLNGISTTTKTTGKIIKKKAPKDSSSNSLSVSEIKLEEHKFNSKSLRQAKKSYVYKYITQEQIQKLIHYIENDEMSINAASKKVGISSTTGSKYYNMYMNGPEHKIPEPLERYIKRMNLCTQDQINALITHIVKDKMTAKEASRKVRLSISTVYKYYKLYLDDPGRQIPKLSNVNANAQCTQEQIKTLIENIVYNKMSILAASRKVNMSEPTGRKYYTMYKEDPERNIPKSFPLARNHNAPCTQEQVNSLIECIVKNGMSVLAASIKANMSISTARKYYSIYLNDPNHEIPTPRESGYHFGKQYVEDKRKEIVNYIVNDKMSIQAASKKAKVCIRTAYGHYSRYLKNINP